MSFEPREDRRRWQWFWKTALVVGLLTAFGCGDIEGEKPPSDSDLYHHSEVCDEGQQRCVVGTTTGETRTLSARLVDADGSPVEDALIEYQLDPRSPETGGDLSADGVLTDEDGVATVDFRPDEGPGRVDVTARVQNAEGVNDLEWQIDITSKSTASYIVDFDYRGSSQIDGVQPLLFDDGTSCDQLVGDFFEDHTWPSAELGLAESDVHDDGSIDDASHQPVSNGDAFTVVGLAHRDASAQSVDVAFGCNDEAGAVAEGEDVTVQLDLHDHVPHLGDRYRTTNHLLITESLPDPVQTIVELLNQLAENPASVLIGGEDYTGLIDDVLVDYLPGSIVEDYILPLLENPAIVDIIHDFINGIIEGMLPGWVDDAQQIVSDITNVMEEFEAYGEFQFDGQTTRERTDDGGVVGHVRDVRHVWDEVVFEWSRGCGDPGSSGYEECARVPIDVGDLDQDGALAEGEFDGTVVGSDQLEIERHSLSLNYGALMVAAFEKLVLQRLFGEDTSSVDDLVDVSLGDCEQLASEVAAEDSGLEDTAEGLCDVLVGQVRDALYEYFVDSLDAAGDDQFELMTPDGQPCSLQQPDEYLSSDWPGAPLPYIETLGQTGEGMECAWRVETDLPLTSDPGVVEGEFQGQYAQ